MTPEEAIEVLKDVKLGIFIETYFDEPEKIVSKENKALDMAIKALEQQPCEDCVNREDVRRLICKNNDKYGYSDRFHEFTEECLSLPSVQPTRPTGKWIDIGNEGLVFKCSLCGNKNTIESNYCSNCGARMGESEA